MVEEVRDSICVKELRAEKFGLGIAPTVADVTGISCTNWTNDVDMDCNASADAAIADVLATLIKILQAKGILGGTVTP